MKKVVTISVLLAIIVMVFTGCNETPQRVVRLNCQESLEDNAYFTITHNQEEERLEIFYEAADGESDFSTYFTLELNCNGKTVWSTYNDTNDESYPLEISFSDESNVVMGTNPKYGITGETTVYVSYAKLTGDVKEFFDSFAGNTAYSIYINNYLCPGMTD